MADVTPSSSHPPVRLTPPSSVEPGPSTSEVQDVAEILANLSERPFEFTTSSSNSAHPTTPRPSKMNISSLIDPVPTGAPLRIPPGGSPPASDLTIDHEEPVLKVVDEQDRPDEQLIDLIDCFKNGHAVGEWSDLEQLFTKAIGKHGLQPLLHLQVDEIVYEKGSPPDNMESPRSEATEGSASDERELRVEPASVPILVTKCRACDDLDGSVFRVRYPLEGSDCFGEDLAGHLLSPEHLQRTEDKLKVANRMEPSFNPSSSSSKRTRLDRRDSSDQDDSDGLSSDEDSHPRDRKKRTRLHSASSSATPVAHSDSEDDIGSPSMAHGLSDAQKSRLVESRYDITRLDRMCEQLQKLYMANHYDTSLYQSGSGSGKLGPDGGEVVEEAGKYEGPPDMRLFAKNGPVTQAEEACEILGLKDSETPLEGMVYPLTSTQLTAAASIWKMMDNTSEQKERGFLLCDAVGTGKTCSALTTFVKDIREEGKVRNTMILCPEGIQTVVWKAEIEKHLPGLVSQVAIIVTQGDWQRFILKSLGEKPIVIISFELLQRSGKTDAHKESATVNLSFFSAYRLIVDEFQHLRHPRTRLAKVSTSYADERHIKHVLLLSGTPAPSSVSDLFVPLRMINIIPVDQKFRPWASGIRLGRYEQADELERVLTGSFYISRAFDFADALPRGQAHSVRDQGCSPVGREKQIIRLLRKKLLDLHHSELARLADTTGPDDYIQEGSPLLQVLEGMRLLSCSFQQFHAWCREASQQGLALDPQIFSLASAAVDGLNVPCKIEAIAQYIARIVAEGDPSAKILVVGHDSVFQEALTAVLSGEKGFTQFIGLTDESPASKEMMVYDSQVHDRQTKESMLELFSKKPSIRVLMGPLASLSEGKNLQICRYLLLLDTPRSPASFVQICGRLLRHGQNHSVATVRYFSYLGPDEMYQRLVYGRTPIAYLHETWNHKVDAGSFARIDIVVIGHGWRLGVASTKTHPEGCRLDYAIH